MSIDRWMDKEVCYMYAMEYSVQFSLVQFNRSVSDSLRPHELQHCRPPCPSPTPGVHSCPSSQWCHPAISSSVIPFSSCPQSLPASGLFQWGMQIVATMRYYFPPVRTAIIKKSTNNKCWRRCGEKGSFCTVGGNVNWYSHYGKYYGDSLKDSE